jgi:hypothetical protein
MQLLLLDTNVIVSALISRGMPDKILYELVLAEKVNVCYSEMIYLEYKNVLNRTKFSRYSNFKSEAESVLFTIETIGLFFEPAQSVNLIKDAPDNRFLELALAASADF